MVLLQQTAQASNRKFHLYHGAILLKRKCISVCPKRSTVMQISVKSIWPPDSSAHASKLPGWPTVWLFLVTEPTSRIRYGLRLPYGLNMVL